MPSKKLKYVANACLIVGFAVPFLVSHFIGMRLGKMPLVSTANIVLWAAGLVLAYFVFHNREKTCTHALTHDENRQFHLRLRLDLPDARHSFRIPLLPYRREEHRAARRSISPDDDNVHHGARHHLPGLEAHSRETQDR